MKQGSFFLAVLAWFAGSLATEAVTVYTSTPAYYETALANGQGFPYVGTVGGASGVYLGKYSGSYYVLTANHVNGGSFTLGNTYSMIAGSRVQVTPGVDLAIFQVAGDSQLDALSQLILGSSNLTTASTLNMIGYGGGTKRGGYNTPDSESFYSYDGYTEAVIFTDYDPVEGQAQAIGGDSGGGVFYQNGGNLELTGLMVIAGTTSQGVQVTGSVDVGYYRNQILARVPEASTWSFWSVLVVFAAGYVWRQRRKRVRES